MAVYSTKSKGFLSTAHPDLQRLFKAVLTAGYDHAIVCGMRDEVEQNRLYNANMSKVVYPNSKHNTNPSQAVDVYPTVDKKITYNLAECGHFAGYVCGMAAAMGIKIRWGGDWNKNKVLGDEKFRDYGHFEIIL